LIEKLEQKEMLAQKKKFLKDFIVLVVSKTGENKVRSLNDLTKDGIVLSIADPRAPVGRYAEKGLQNSGLFDTIVAKGNIKAKPSTVNQLAILVQKDQVDAGLIFQSVANMYGLPPIDSMGTDLTGEIVFGIGVIKGGNEALANKFMEFAVQNVAEFVSYGWQPYE
jgi:molybdate transport system substrate-binding protein